jgi:hypothetical protein
MAAVFVGDLDHREPDESGDHVELESSTSGGEGAGSAGVSKESPESAKAIQGVHVKRCARLRRQHRYPTGADGIRAMRR